MTDSNIMDSLHTSIVTTHISAPKYQQEPHELAADIQDSFSMIESIIDAKLQISNTSKVLDVAVWLAEFSCNGLRVLIHNTPCNKVINTIRDDSESLCTLIGISYSSECSDSKDTLEIAAKLSNELEVRVGAVCTELYKSYKQGEVL
jgi:hypothetical protein